MSPLKKICEHTYIPTHKINCCHFNFYWRAQNNKTCLAECGIVVYRAGLIVLIYLMLQVLHRFLPISPILEHSQRRQWNPGWTNFWSLCNHQDVGIWKRFMCLGLLGKRIRWCKHLTYFIAEPLVARERWASAPESPRSVLRPDHR